MVLRGLFNTLCNYICPAKTIYYPRTAWWPEVLEPTVFIACHRIVRTHFMNDDAVLIDAGYTDDIRAINF